ncbi:anthranilate synthase component II [Sediminibacillus massiliensis]|uniref:anthranilate synthase component II n=1 Tax=Sediminibacillus massiliensis TaxID=1926277 RepID=UPI0009889459|nr:aminodeoxychorismate/anthranilate synthase component II [Sediminibacillus massiliensis]
MILLIDNYDSFTYNLFQYISELGKEVKVVRNDKISVKEIRDLEPEAVILSPGPGTPEKAGICMDIVTELSDRFPILGICLGHQAIGAAFGGKVIHANHIKHGKTSEITHTGIQLFDQLKKPLDVMRYHSLVVDRNSLPECLEVTASAVDDKEIMALRHRQLPVFGLQFHPESIGTKTGKAILENFFTQIGEENPYETIS